MDVSSPPLPRSLHKHRRFTNRPLRNALLFALSVLASSLWADQSVTLAWDPNPEPDVSGYIVYFGNASRNYPYSTNVGNVTTATVYGLQEGLTYFFAITATNTSGLESDYSNEVTNAVPADLTNTVPTISPIADLTVPENQTTPPIAFTVGDVETSVSNLIVWASSTNTSLVPIANLHQAGNGAQRTIQILPATNAFGVTLITLTVSDGAKASSTSFLLSVTPDPTHETNSVPTISHMQTLVMGEDDPGRTLEFWIDDRETPPALLVVSASSSDVTLVPSGNIRLGGTGSRRQITLRPAPNHFGRTTIALAVSDGTQTTRSSFVVIVNPINDPPTLAAIPDRTIHEDAGLQTIPLQGISTGATNESQTLAVTASSDNPALIPAPTVNYTSPNATGTLTFTPAPNASGRATISVEVDDGGGSNNIVARSFVVIVNPVNDTPTLAAIPDRTIREDAGLQTIPLQGISTGATNESQMLTITAWSNTPDLIPHPQVIYDSPNETGTLRLEPATNAFGEATIMVMINDGEATNNVAAQFFTVTVTPVNDPPTLDSINDLTIAANTNRQVIRLTGISSGASNESQELTVNAISNRPDLLPHPTVTYTSPDSTAMLSFQPGSNAVGSVTINVWVSDQQPINSWVARTFTVNIVAPAGEATLDAIADLRILEDAGQQTIDLTGIGSSATDGIPALTVTATSSNPALIPPPTIVYRSPETTAQLLLRPQPDANGSAEVTVTVADGGAFTQPAVQTFRVMVEPVNDPPRMDQIPSQVVTENTGPKEVFTDSHGSHDYLFVFNPANTLPVLNPVVQDLSDVNEHVLIITGVSSGPANEQQSLTLSAFSSEPSLVPNPSIDPQVEGDRAVLRFTPVAHRQGGALIVVTLSDGQENISRAFWITVTPARTAMDHYFTLADLLNPARQQTVWGDHADPDRDGRDNLLEYALGLNPIQADPSRNVLAASLIELNGKKHLALTFARRKNDASLEYVPEVSTNRHDWSSGPAVTREIIEARRDLSPQFESVSIYDRIAVELDRPRFIRLRVNQAGLDDVAAGMHYSESFVAMALVACGGSPESPQHNFFSLPMVAPVAAAGTITALGDRVLQDTNATWQTGEYSASNGTFYVEFDSGQMIDIIDCDSRNGTLTLPASLPEEITAGEAYRIRKHKTLAEIFGPHNEAGLRSDPDLNESDTILLLNSAIQETETYHYLQSPQRAGWFSTDGALAGQLTIFPEQGLVVLRKATNDLVLYFSGSTKVAPTLVPILPEFNLVGSMQVYRALTLPELNLYTGDPVTGLVGALDVDTADHLVLIDHLSQANTYFYSTNQNSGGWRDENDFPANNVTVPPGSAFFIERISPVGPFQWSVPAE